jgi:ketosteroid isomerase-like protein
MAEGRIADLVRRYFDAYQAADRPAMEALLAGDFTFTSPWDDHISRDRYFEHCWPHAGSFGFRRPLKIFAEGDEAFVHYRTEAKSGGSFSNTELMRFEGGKLRSVEAFFGFIPGAVEAGAASPETEIKAVIGERIEAMRTGDAKRAVATLADNIVAFELAPPLRLAADQARDPAALEAWFGTWRGGVDIEIGRLTVAAAGDVGYAHSLNRLRGTKADGTAVDFWVRSTLGFRKTADGWKIAHGHTSVPFHMDGSLRAALDLQP